MNSTDTVMFTDHVHMLPLRDRTTGGGSSDTPARPVAPAGAHLTYRGGKVIQKVQVTQVLYGSGTYLPELTATADASMASAYTQMTTSGVLDWLSEYNTSSPPQTIDHGSFRGSVLISPDASRDGSTISDASVQSELVSQIRSGALPAPDDNQLYMVSVPAGKSLVAPDGSLSCVSFCAYHGTFKIGSQHVYYGVLPALTGGCATGCGDGTPFQNQQSVASHELIEAITDPEVGLATIVGSPLAWYDASFGEIGDLCISQPGSYVGRDGNSYTLQREFSNTANDCILTRSATRTSDVLWRNLNTGEVAEWTLLNEQVVGADIHLSTRAGEWRIQGTGDFNGGGTTDILWRNVQTGEVTVWLMVGGQLAQTEIHLFSEAPEWQIHGTGDFNGDGTTDVLWRHTQSGNVTVWIMVNGGVSGGEVPVSTKSAEWQIQGTGDFNGDHTTDILWRNTKTGEVTEWIMGSGTLASPEIHLFEVPGEWQIQGTGDFNGDGTSDILWRNVETGEVTEWIMLNGQVVGAELHLFARPAEWQIQGTGDFNGDGTSDILWRNIETGEVTEWILVNGRVAGTEIHLFARPTEWQIQGIGNVDGN